MSEDDKIRREIEERRRQEEERRRIEEERRQRELSEQIKKGTGSGDRPKR